MVKEALNVLKLRQYLQVINTILSISTFKVKFALAAEGFTNRKSAVNLQTIRITNPICQGYAIRIMNTLMYISHVLKNV